MKNIILYYPPIFEDDVKVIGKPDGELFYLGQYFFQNNYNPKILDNYFDNNDTFLSEYTTNLKPDAIIVHLAKAGLIYNNNLNKLLLKLYKLKLIYNYELIFFGSLALALNFELYNYNRNLIDSIVSDSEIIGKKSKISILVKNYLCSQITLDLNYLKMSKFNKYYNTLFTSRGCNNNCGFCHYNFGINKWRERNIENVITDIKLMHNEYGFTKFSLFDNNFGLNLSFTESKVNNYYKKINCLDFPVKFSINASSSILNKTIIQKLSFFVDVLLIGLESFSQNTIINIYNKKQNIPHTIELIKYMEDLGIFPVISYILFHPWITLDELKEELFNINKFGRERLIHFLSKSKIYVMPNTLIERRLIRDKLIKKIGFERTYRFQDEKVTEIYDSLNSFFKSNYKYYNSTPQKLLQLKSMEWELLNNLVF